ncbi:hypothetical protein ECZU43_25500 [Escherichia coli]|nr:hypothetical protein ECZU08_37030 [Escherichia coli]GHM18492.1 hypothetical protein ECZU43_25500 [Escherichia coli]
MDELLTLGCIALFFALVVVPILAIIALSRSTAVRSELATLRRRVEVLEQRGVTEAPATVVTTVPQSVSQMVVPVETSSPAVNIVLSEPVADVTPESVDPASTTEAAKRGATHTSGRTIFRFWWGDVVPGALVYAGQPAGKAGYSASLPWLLLPAALYG